MKITLLHYAAPPVVGGVETVLAKQAEVLSAAGHEVTILAGRGKTWDEKIPVITIPMIDSRHPTILSLKEHLDVGVIPPGFDRAVTEIRKLLLSHLDGTDCLIAHNVASLHKNLALTTALHSIAESRLIRKMVLWHHDLAWRMKGYACELYPGLPWDLLRTAWTGVIQVVVSDSRREELSELFQIPQEQIHVIPAGVDINQFWALQPTTWSLYNDLGMSLANPLILAPVRITRRKNIELGLQIMAELLKDLPEAVMVVTGPTGAHNPANKEYLSQLLDLRHTLGLDKQVHFLAERYPEGISDRQVAEFYRLADALLITSRDEGFGIPILEAGIGRLDIFCTDLPSLRALAGDWAVYFSPDAEPAEASRKIMARLETNPIYRMRAEVRQAYTWPAIYRRQLAPLLDDSTNTEKLDMPEEK